MDMTQVTPFISLWHTAWQQYYTHWTLYSAVAFGILGFLAKREEHKSSNVVNRLLLSCFIVFAVASLATFWTNHSYQVLLLGESDARISAWISTLAQVNTSIPPSTMPDAKSLYNAMFPASLWLVIPFHVLIDVCVVWALCSKSKSACAGAERDTPPASPPTSNAEVQTRLS
jgi:hypothetical protein